MKSILIDPVRQCIEEVDAGRSLKELYELLDCTILIAVTPDTTLPVTDILYCDDTWENTPPAELSGFFIDIVPGKPLFGKALLVGQNEDDRRSDVKLTVQEVTEIVRFMDPEEVETEYRKIMDDPTWEAW